MAVDAATGLETPKYRGVLHLYAFFAFLALGGGVLAIHSTVWSLEVLWPTTVFALSVLGVFGTSALYHRISWSPRWYERVRRLAHAMIFGLILGTYTPLFAITLADEAVLWQTALVVSLALLGMAVTLFFPRAPKWVRAVIYLAVGWMGMSVAPELWTTLGAPGLSLLVLGGVFYSVGALIYALRRPDPWPGTFGYHEIFHAFVILGVLSHFAAIVFCVAP